MKSSLAKDRVVEETDPVLAERALARRIRRPTLLRHSKFCESRCVPGSKSAFVLASPSSLQCSSPTLMSSIHAENTA